MENERIIYNQVALLAESMTKAELGAMYLAVFFNNSGVKNVLGYDKLKTLFTEKNGTAMHEVTRTAFISYCASHM